MANAVNEARLQIPFQIQAQNRFSGDWQWPFHHDSGRRVFGNSVDVRCVFHEMTPEFTDNFSWTRGAHAFKVGGSVRAARDTQVQPTIANYTFPNVAAYLAANSGVNPETYLNSIQTLGHPAMSYSERSVIPVGCALDGVNSRSDSAAGIPRRHRVTYLWGRSPIVTAVWATRVNG